MTSGRAANDCAGRGSGASALTDVGVTRTKNKRTQRDDQNDYKKIGFHKYLYLRSSLNRASSGRLRGETKRPRRLSSGAISLEPELRPHKNFLRVCVKNKPTVRDVRAIKHLMRRIRATDETRAFMGISFAKRVFSLGCRILLRGFLRSDWCCHHGATRTLRSNLVCASNLAHGRVG